MTDVAQTPVTPSQAIQVFGLTATEAGENTAIGATPPEPVSLAHGLALFDDVKSAYSWNIRRLSVAILSVDFGAPHLRVRGPKPIRADMWPELVRFYQERAVRPIGRYCLFVEDGMWIATSKGGTCHRHDSEPPESAACLRHLSGQTLTDVSWDPDDKLWRFAFDLGGLVTIAAPTDGDGSDSVWILFRDDGHVLSRDDDHALHLEYLPSCDAARRQTDGVNGSIDFVWAMPRLSAG